VPCLAAKESAVKYYCPNCSTHHDVGAAVGGKVAATLAGAALGRAISRNPFVAGATALVGLAIGNFIDRDVIPRCPVCGVILQVLAGSL
jgi:predicted RNA-binding Zn-ribbon protein involved in translation (DUF1610 family)